MALTDVQPDAAPVPRPQGQPAFRRVLMCPPTHFDVTYEINPWMSRADPVDAERACHQWQGLAATYADLDLEVEVVPPVSGLPDMVFAANAGLIINDRVLVARFLHPERRGEEAAFEAWFRGAGFTDVRPSQAVNEGEGDFALVGDTLLGGYGQRTELAAHREAEAWFDHPVVSLRLVDPRYYHLDTALFALGESVAYLPEAFDAPSRAVLERRFPDALLATADDAAVLGLNAVTVGHRVVLPAGADHLEVELRNRGWEPVPVDLSELRKAGGSVKCCTLELRGAGGGTGR